jgi:hypothetical protein
MNRATRIFRKAFIMVSLLRIFGFVPLVSAEVSPAADVLAWVNDLRSRRGLSRLEEDPLLQRTAKAYSADLRDRGVLSHVDEQGRRALQRLKAQGGTTVLVGELLGSGATVLGVSSAWEESPRHREVALNPLWTHCGAAAVQSGSTYVWVVLFTVHRIFPLEILRRDHGYIVRGRLLSAQAREPVLISGIEPLEPLRWNSATGEFFYLVPTERGSIYHRLGYRSLQGNLVVTNTFFPLQAASSGD